MKQTKKTNNDQEHTTQKTKDWATRSYKKKTTTKNKTKTKTKTKEQKKKTGCEPGCSSS